MICLAFSNSSHILMVNKEEGISFWLRGKAGLGIRLVFTRTQFRHSNLKKTDWDRDSTKFLVLNKI